MFLKEFFKTQESAVFLYQTVSNFSLVKKMFTIFLSATTFVLRLPILQTVVVSMIKCSLKYETDVKKQTTFQDKNIGETKVGGK